MFRYVNECLSAAKLYRSNPETLAGLLQAHVSQVSGWWKCYHDMTSILFSSCLLKCLQKITEINRQLELAKQRTILLSDQWHKDLIIIRMAGTRGVWYSIVILTMWKLTLLGMTLIQQKYKWGKNTSVCAFVFYFDITWASLLFFPNISMIENVLFLYKQFNKQLCRESDRNVVLQTTQWCSFLSQWFSYPLVKKVTCFIPEWIRHLNKLNWMNDSMTRKCCFMNGFCQYWFHLICRSSVPNYSNLMYWFNVRL